MGRVKGSRQLRTRSDRKLDVAKALLLYTDKSGKALSLKAIGAIYGVTESAVKRALQPYLHLIGDPQQVAFYRDHEANIFDHARTKILANMLKPGVMERAGLRDLAVSAGILFDKMRLLRGQSTANIGLRAALIIAAHEPRPAPAELTEAPPASAPASQNPKA